jgi:hypothetical protein
MNMPKEQNDGAVMDEIGCEEVYENDYIGTVERPISPKEAAEMLGVGMIAELE